MRVRMNQSDLLCTRLHYIIAGHALLHELVCGCHPNRDGLCNDRVIEVVLWQVVWSGVGRASH